MESELITLEMLDLKEPGLPKRLDGELLVIETPNGKIKETIDETLSSWMFFIIYVTDNIKKDDTVGDLTGLKMKQVVLEHHENLNQWITQQLKEKGKWEEYEEIVSEYSSVIYDLWKDLNG